MVKIRKVLEWILIATFETEDECDKALDASKKALRENIKNDTN